MSLHDVLRHLVLHGPARNDAEREQLLGQVDADERGRQPQPQPEQPEQHEGSDQP